MCGVCSPTPQAFFDLHHYNLKSSMHRCMGCYNEVNPLFPLGRSEIFAILPPRRDGTFGLSMKDLPPGKRSDGVAPAPLLVMPACSSEQVEMAQSAVDNCSHNIRTVKFGAAAIIVLLK